MIEGQDKINFTTDVVIDGKTYFQSLAHQLAAYVCKKEYDNFRLRNKKGFMNAEIYMEEIIVKGGFFFSERLGKKFKICDLNYNVDKDRIAYIQQDYENSEESLFIQYEIFKYLRDFDLIQINTIERKVCHKSLCVYRILKHNALNCGHLVNTEKHGKKFVIPKSKFNCEIKVIKKKTRKRR